MRSALRSTGELCDAVQTNIITCYSGHFAYTSAISPTSTGASALAVEERPPSLKMNNLRPTTQRRARGSSCRGRTSPASRLHCAHPAEPTEAALNSRCPRPQRGSPGASERARLVPESTFLEKLQWALRCSLSLSLRSSAPLHTEAWVEDAGGARLRGTGPDAPRSTQRSGSLLGASSARPPSVEAVVRAWRASLTARLC